MTENKHPIRKGECNNCGWCCQFNGIHRNVVQAGTGDIDFLKLRGGRLLDTGEVLYIAYEYAPCKEHDISCSKCKIYDNRPTTCQEFPQEPGQIEGTPCSFWFEDEKGNKRGGDGSPHPTPPIFLLGEKPKLTRT